MPHLGYPNSWLSECFGPVPASLDNRDWTVIENHSHKLHHRSMAYIIIEVCNTTLTLPLWCSLLRKRPWEVGGLQRVPPPQGIRSRPFMQNIIQDRWGDTKRHTCSVNQHGIRLTVQVCSRGSEKSGWTKTGGDMHNQIDNTHNTQGGRQKGVQGRQRGVKHAERCTKAAGEAEYI